MFEGTGFHAAVEGEAVFKAIGSSEFWCPPFPESGVYCGGGKPTAIVSVSHDDGSWRLVLRSRWDQEVTLDSKFKIASTRCLPDAKQLRKAYFRQRRPGIEPSNAGSTATTRPVGTPQQRPAVP